MITCIINNCSIYTTLYYIMYYLFLSCAINIFFPVVF